MSATIIIDPDHDFFGAFSTGYVTFWLGSVLIESSHVTKNPCDPARCSVFTLAIVEPGAAKNREVQLEVMLRLAIEPGFPGYWLHLADAGKRTFGR
jgi:hypothetical protein